MRLYMATDLEGVAGVYSFEDQAVPTGRYYEAAKKLLTGEVNAAIEGALEAGVTDFLISDGHGCGGIHYESLHPRACVIQGRPRLPRGWYGDGRYDIACVIGQHAMEGTNRAVLNHTQDNLGVEYYKLNGQYIGETAQTALYLGYYGVPVIFLSGDTAACKEAEDLIPGVFTSAVKDGLSLSCAASLSLHASRQLIRETITKAILRHKQNPFKPLVWEPPFKMEIRMKRTELADRYESSGWKRKDSKTVENQADLIIDIIYS